MGKYKYTDDFRRKHILEIKLEDGSITDEELIELNKLIRHFNQMLHRFKANG